MRDLIGQNPNLPSDLSFAPGYTSHGRPRGLCEAIKRELGDIRAKLSRILGQERNQEENPFSVGGRVLITILPHENRNKIIGKMERPIYYHKNT